MCGIAGFVGGDVDPHARGAAVERMCAALEHRGPDGRGTAQFPEIALGMRRLAIFDPARGHQPMQTPEGRFHLVFNGALYNHRELRRVLEGSGHTFRTDCDTEVLLAAFAQWGEQALDRLRGMFAFAVWDAREHTLFLARDPFGIKPLYYARRGAGLLFASELGALLASGDVSDAIDPGAVNESLSYLAVPAPRTLYRDVASLRPGECAAWRAGELSVRTYWDFSDATAAPVRPAHSRAEFLSQLREQLVESVRAHALADVPVGAFLSGGLDSAAIVGLMRHLGPGQLRTFSIGFNETEYSETAAAEAAAVFFRTEHQTLVLSGERVAADIDRIVSVLDQPTGDAINTYYVSELARAGGVKVALSGLGGDELFGGYPWFRTTPRLARALPFWSNLPEALREAVLRHLRGRDARQQKLADLLTHAEGLHGLAALQRRNFAESARTSLLLDPPAYTSHPELFRLEEELSGADAFSAVSAWELRTYMADVLLRDSDVMSMRHGLELRVPFVDRPLIEWFWKQPERFKQSLRRNKPALADAVEVLLPPGTGRRRKQGFTLPFALWMRGPLRPFLEDTFSRGSVERAGYLSPDAVQARWQRYLGSNDSREWSRIWSLAILIAFLNRRRRPSP